MTFIYAFIFIGAVIGAANLIMSYDEVKRSTLTVSAIFIVAAPLAALHIGIKPGVLEAAKQDIVSEEGPFIFCLLYTSPSPRDRQKSRMPSSA